MIRWREFRDNYCKHQNGILVFGDDTSAKLGCSYKDGKNAQSWADWQPCSKANCPALKEESHDNS